MKKKSAIITIILGTLVTLMAAGCTRGVSEADYNRVVEERDQAMSKIASLEGELATAKEHIVFLQQKIAINFVKNSPTFIFDGIENTLELVDSEELEDPVTWIYTYEFQSRHAGYGDRTGQMLLQVITPHEAVITILNGEITSAVMDEKWDMLKQNMINELEDITWVLTAYTDETGTVEALEDVEVTIIFDGTEKQLSGIAGCNQYGAPYEIYGSNLTVTGSIIRTEMFCGDEIMEQEEYYLKALQEAEGYEVNENKMTITGGGWILEFEKQQ